MRLGLLLVVVLAAACDGAASAPTLHLTLVPSDTLSGRDTMTLDLAATLRPCEGDSAFLVEADADGMGALLMLRLNSLAAGSYSVGLRHRLAIRYQGRGVSTMFRGDSGTITIGGGGRALDLAIEGTVLDPYSVRRRVSGRLEGLKADTTRVRCAPSGG
ncbi:MAG: hypothetical protein ACREN5_07350 [Gemmatimonadales bacterium]